MTQPSATSLQALAQVIETCQNCSLSGSRGKAVPGQGASTSDLFFIGEAPGSSEDQQGVPFVGAAGKLLDLLLAEIALSRTDIFITNMVKCRPPNNRDPLPEEVSACSQYLESQIAAVSPKIIVTLGRHAFNRFFPGESIMKARGEIRSFGELRIFPVLHPAAALYRRELQSVLKEDFAKLRELLNEFEVSVDADSDGDDSAQLTMF